jgi:hypothetical protein
MDTTSIDVFGIPTDRASDDRTSVDGLTVDGDDPSSTTRIPDDTDANGLANGF